MLVLVVEGYFWLILTTVFLALYLLGIKSIPDFEVLDTFTSYPVADPINACSSQMCHQLKGI